MPGELRGYWDMQTLENDLLVDFSGHGNDLTKQNSGQSPAPGRMGGAHNFNATLSDRVSVASNNSLNMTDQVTLTFWLYHSMGASPANITGLIGKALTAADFQYFAYMDTSRNIVMVWDDGATSDTLTSSTALTNRTWYHIACVFDWTNNIQRLYIDGVRDNTSTSTRATHSSAATFSLGRYTDANTASRFLDGYIDEVYLFNRVLSDLEVKELAGSNGEWQVRARKTNIDGWQAIDNFTDFAWEKANRTIGQMSGTVYNMTQEPGNVDSQREGLRFDMETLTRTGTMKDSSPQNSNDGTIIGELTVVDGPWGRARDFSANKIVVSDDNSIDYNSELSVFAWVKPDVLAQQSILIKGDTGDYEYELRMENSSGQMLATIFQSSSSGHAAATSGLFNLATNIWAHVGFTWDETTLRLYIDAIERGTDTTFSGTPAGGSRATDLIIGSRANDTLQWDGGIDEVRVYTKELSLAEVEVLADYHPPEDVLLQRGSEVAIQDGDQKEWFRGLIEQVDHKEDDLRWDVRALGTSQNGVKKKWIGRKNLSSLPPDVLADEVSSSLNGQPASDLRFYSNMETLELDGDLSDLSGNGNHGAFSSSAATSAVGKWSNAYDFSGTDQNFVITDDASLDIVDSLTLAAWIKTDTISGTQKDIIAKQGAYALVRDGANIQGHSTVSSSNRTTGSNLSIVPGRWYHVAFTYDGENHRLYIDGVLDTTDAQTGALDTTANDLTIGADDTATPTDEFDGIIDDVYVYNRALSLTEIRQLAGREIFSGNFWRPVDGTVRYDMESLSGSDMEDFSPNGNNGTITGTTIVDGAHGLCRSFGTGAGSTDRIATGADLDGASSITNMAWIRIANAGSGETTQQIMSSTSGTTNQLTMTLSGSSGGIPTSFDTRISTSSGGNEIFSASFTFVVGTWYHIAATWDSSHVRQYIDGVLRATNAKAGTLDATGDEFIIGHDGDQALHSRTFQDRIDDIRILANVIMDEAEINFYMNHTEGVYTESDISYRSEEDARIYTVDGMANVFDADWSVERDEVDNDVVVFVDALGSGPGDPQDTFQLQNDIIELERRVDSERLFTDLTVLGHGDGENQLVSRAFHATNIRTTLSADYSSSSTSAFSVGNTSAFPFEGVVYMGAERIHYTGISSTQLGTTSVDRDYGVSDDGYETLDAYAHEEGTSVYLHIIMGGYPTTGLQLYYDMQTLTGGQMEDLSSNTNHGTITGTDDAEGQLGRARDFEQDDTNNVIEAVDDATLDPATTMSVSAWFKLESFGTSNSNGLVKKEGQYQLETEQQSSNEVIAFSTVVSSSTRKNASGGTALALNRWYHTVAVYDSAASPSHIIYLDGVSDNTFSGTGSIDNTGNPFQVGQEELSATPIAWMDGVIDEVFFWDVALTAAEVEALYNRRPVPLTPESPEDNSSIDLEGWTRGTYADRAITNQDSLDRFAATLLEKYREERDSVTIDIYQDVITADLGDYITIYDADGRDFKSSPYKIVGLKFSWPFKQWTITVGAQRESAERVIQDTAQQSAVSTTYGRTKQAPGGVESDTADVTVTTTTEKLIDTITLSSDVREGQRVAIAVSCNLVTGTDASDVRFRVREDNGTDSPPTGTLIQAAYRVDNFDSAGDRVMANFVVTATAPSDGPSYVFTVQQTGATGNGTAEIYSLTAYPSG